MIAEGAIKPWPPVGNLDRKMVLSSLAGGQHTYGPNCTALEKEFSDSGYGEFKIAVAEAASEFLAPVRERYSEIRPDEATLDSVLADGAGKATEIASGVLEAVRGAMGLGPSRA